jgi:acyl-CoA synthetase (AMP-forming)/AMP-acid ligase II
MNLVTALLHDSDAGCLIDSSQTITYSQLQDSALKIAQALCTQCNVEPGDRVALLAHNSSEFVTAYLALLACGATVIPLDPYASEAERARDISR